MSAIGFENTNGWQTFLRALRPQEGRTFRRLRHREPRGQRIMSACEHLETRTLLTAYIVDTTLDTPAAGAGDTDGLVSLREAITAANTNAAFGDAAAGEADLTGGPNGDTITFDASLAGQTITLGGVQLTITDELSITGLGQTQLTISGNNASRVFAINAGVTASIEDLTATSGVGSNGGAIFTQGTLSVTDITVSNSTASIAGGGIYSAGTLSVTNSTVTSNSAHSMTGFGGGVHIDGTGTILNSVISDNTAHHGAGLYLDVGATATVAGSTISGNVAEDHGGGVDNHTATLAIIDSTISGNSSTSATSTGGGIYNNNGPLTVTGSTISGNSAGLAGGALATAGTTTIANSTISGNVTDGDGGGIYAWPEVGPLDVTLRNVTVFGNRADADGNASGSGGGIYVGHPTTLFNTLVAGNLRGALAGTPDDISGNPINVTSANNLIGDAATAGGLTNGNNGNVVGVDSTTVIDPTLRDNGGPTLTHALLAGSAAVNAGDNAQALAPGGGALTTDQRGTGFPRIVDVTVDIGAFEQAAPVAADDEFMTDEDHVLSGNLFDDNGNGVDSDPDSAVIKVTAVNGQALVGGTINLTLPSGALLTVNENGDFTYDPNGVFNGLGFGETANDSFGYTISDEFGSTDNATAAVVINGLSDGLPDFNGDGLADVIEMKENGEWWVGLSNGTDTFTEELWADWADASTWLHVDFGDFNGDDLTDILGVTTSGGVWVAFSNGIDAFDTATRWIDPLGLAFNWYHIGVGDFDGNGVDDIAGFAADGTWSVGLSDGAASFITSAEPWDTWVPESNWVDFEFGDFNGDGFTDVAGFTHWGGWWVGLNNALGSVGTPDDGGFVHTKWATWASATQWADFEVGDFDNDGSDDVAGFDINGDWLIGSSTGAGFDTGTVSADWRALPDWGKIGLGDFNDDGFADLVGVTIWGGWFVALNDTMGGFDTSRWAKWEAVANWAQLDLIDVNGSESMPIDESGATDAVGFNQNGDWRVGVSNATDALVGDAFWADWDPASTWATLNDALTLQRRLDRLALV